VLCSRRAGVLWCRCRAGALQSRVDAVAGVLWCRREAGASWCRRRAGAECQWHSHGAGAQLADGHCQQGRIH
jgi:predicted NUDIX family NTP pyrophosphohydrolase